jgi:hypothetical protein
MAETVAPPPPASLTNVAMVAPPGETSRETSVRSDEHDERSNIGARNKIVTWKLLCFFIGYRLTPDRSSKTEWQLWGKAVDSSDDRSWPVGDRRRRRPAPVPLSLGLFGHF